MIMYLFDKEFYKDGLDKESLFNIFRWNEQMCQMEFEADEERDSNMHVFKIDSRSEMDRNVFEYDFNEKNGFSDKYILRMFE